jgi:hypothetical protein
MMFCTHCLSTKEKCCRRRKVINAEVGDKIVKVNEETELATTYTVRRCNFCERLFIAYENNHTCNICKNRNIFEGFI